MNTTSELKLTELLKQTALLLEQGELKQAGIILQQQLTENPTQPDLLYQIAILNLKEGKSQVALQHLLNLRVLNPHSPSILNLLGVVYSELRNYTQALTAYQAALAVSPKNIDIMTNSALTKVRLGDKQGLVELTQYITGKSELKLVLKLIEAYRLNANHGAAKRLCQETLVLHPQNQQLWSLLADIEVEGFQQVDHAIAIYTQQIQAHPQQHKLREALCQLLLKNHQTHLLYLEAQELIKLHQHTPTGYFWLANALYMMLSIRLVNTLPFPGTTGTTTEEELHLELKSALKKLAQFPRTIPASIIHIKSLRLFGEAQEALSLCEELISQGDYPEVLTEAGKLQLELGNTEQAANYLQQAIQLNSDHSEAWFNLVLSTPSHDPQAKIVQLTSILNTNKKLSAQDELHYRFALAKSLDDIHDYDAAWLQYTRANSLKSRNLETFVLFTKFVQELSQQGTVPTLSLTANEYQPIFIVGMPRSGTTLLEQFISNHSQLHGAGELGEIGKLHQQLRYTISQQRHAADLGTLIQQLRARYLAVSTKAGSIIKRVIDKMPTNFLNLSFIFTLFPHAQVIHCQRHPLDICVSSLRRSLDWPFCDENYIGKYFHLQQQLMQHWKAMYDGRIHTVNYEDVIHLNEPTIRNVIHFLNLPWEDNCLDHTTNKRLVSTPSRTQVRNKLYDSSISNWKHYTKFLGNIVNDIGEESITQEWQAHFSDNH